MVDNVKKTENKDSFRSLAGEDILMADFKTKITENFSAAYSSFCIFYPAIYATRTSPIYSLINDDVARSQLFNDKELSKYVTGKPYINPLPQYSAGPYAQSNDYYFIHRLNENFPGSRIYNKYNTKDKGNKYTRKEAITVGIQLRNDSKITCLNSNAKDYFKLTYQNMKQWEKNRIFCDGFFIHNLIELTINNLGQTHHINMGNHSRFAYKAKETEMNIDVFTFDRCIPFYMYVPSLPMFEYATNLEESELFLRIMIDVIGGKQSTFTPLNNYRGSNTVSLGELSTVPFVTSISNRNKIE